MKKADLLESFKEDIPFLESSSHNEIFEFFKPYLKAKSYKEPEQVIPIEKVKEFNELWPKGKLPTGKYGRCSEYELKSSFAWFFKNNPEFTNWDVIISAAKTYLAERESENWEHTRRSKYFVRKQLADRSWISDLSEYYERAINNTPDENQRTYFEPRIR